MRGLLIAFEGLDQSGKQTQAELLRDHLKSAGRKARLLSFPDYGTSIGEEIARALQGDRDYGADRLQNSAHEATTTEEQRPEPKRLLS